MTSIPEALAIRLRNLEQASYPTGLLIELSAVADSAIPVGLDPDTELVLRALLNVGARMGDVLEELTEEATDKASDAASRAVSVLCRGNPSLAQELTRALDAAGVPGPQQQSPASAVAGSAPALQQQTAKRPARRRGGRTAR